MQTKAQLIASAASIASSLGLSPSIVCAMVEHESSWNPFAIRYEPKFFTNYTQPLWTRGLVKSITEAQARAFSWGLMQVMGQVAREMGFTGDLPELCDPLTGLLYGCRLFAKNLAAHSGDVSASLEAYNGGANPNYAAEVLALVPHYELPPAPAGSST